jgi:hypothetical protein
MLVSVVCVGVIYSAQAHDDISRARSVDKMKSCACWDVFGINSGLTRREFLPWYFVWVLPFVALLPTMTTVLVIASGLSLGLLLQYAPYLYYGHWNAPVPVLKWWVTVVPVALASIGLFLRHMIVSRNSVRRRDS